MRATARMQRVTRPDFKAFLTKEECFEFANNALRADHPTAVAFRATCVQLSVNADEMIKFFEGDPKETIAYLDCLLEWLNAAEKYLKARLEMMTSAKARTLWAAAWASQN